MTLAPPYLGSARNFLVNPLVTALFCGGIVFFRKTAPPHLGFACSKGSNLEKPLGGFQLYYRKRKSQSGKRCRIGDPAYVRCLLLGDTTLLLSLQIFFLDTLRAYRIGDLFWHMTSLVSIYGVFCFCISWLGAQFEFCISQRSATSGLTI